MLFSRATDITDSSFHIITLTGHSIDRVSEYRYLGIWLDQKLTFKFHIDSLASKLRQKIGFFYRNKTNFPFKHIFVSFTVTRFKDTFLMEEYAPLFRGKSSSSKKIVAPQEGLIFRHLSIWQSCGSLCDARVSIVPFVLIGLTTFNFKGSHLMGMALSRQESYGINYTRIMVA